MIPVFQGTTTGGAQQWAKLWDNVVNIQTAPEKRGNHFMGFLVFLPGLPEPGKHTTFHIIDGQQRLATLSILMAALAISPGNTAKRNSADEIHQDYLVHIRKEGTSIIGCCQRSETTTAIWPSCPETAMSTGRMADVWPTLRKSCWLGKPSLPTGCAACSTRCASGWSSCAPRSKGKAHTTFSKA